jgi:hypothetical protein
MSRLITRRGEFFKKYGRFFLAYPYLIALFVFAIPYAACQQSDIFLQISGRFLATLFIVIIGLAIVGLLTHDTREVVRRYVRLISTLKYSLIFGLLLVYLPLTACDKFPLHNLLGGLFVELDRWTIFFIATLMFAAMWSLAFTQGITIDSIEGRFLINDYATSTRGDHIWQKGYISKGAYKFFDSRITRAQLSLYSLFILIGVGIITTPSEKKNGLLSTVLAMFPALLIAFAGLLFGLLLVYGISYLLGYLIKWWFYAPELIMLWYDANTKKLWKPTVFLPVSTEIKRHYANGV